MKTLKLFWLSLAALSLVESAHAQVGSAPAKPSGQAQRQLCVIAVGSPAGNIAEWESDTVFSFRPTDPGATPPMNLYYKKSGEERADYELFPMGLGVSTKPILATTSQIVLYKKSEDGQGKAGYSPEMSLPMGSGSLTALVMWRDRKKPNWTEPNILPIDAGLEAWPEGQVRFLNLTPAVIGLSLKEGKFLVSPYKSYTSEVEISTPHPYRLDAAINGESTFIASSAVSMSVPSRKLVVVYGNQKGELESMVINVPAPLDLSQLMVKKEAAPSEVDAEQN